MADRLIVEEERRHTCRIVWELDDGEETGGTLCQSESDGKGDPPKDRGDWEHWMASKVVREMPSTKYDSFGAYWDDFKQAKAALAVVNEALKQERPMPEWAKTALEAGWKPPKGWKA
jgi:hypothetical protein